MALERRILPEIFWESSVLEVSDLIEAADRLRVADIRRNIEIQFVTADVIANRIARIFSDPKKRIPVIYPWTAFPDLFEDRSEEIEEQRKLRETEQFKDGLYAFAARWNGRNKQE